MCSSSALPCMFYKVALYRFPSHFSSWQSARAFTVSTSFSYKLFFPPIGISIFSNSFSDYLLIIARLPEWLQRSWQIWGSVSLWVKGKMHVILLSFSNEAKYLLIYVYKEYAHLLYIVTKPGIALFRVSQQLSGRNAKIAEFLLDSLLSLSPVGYLPSKDRVKSFSFSSRSF